MYCDIFFKVSKVLVKRSKNIFPEIISNFQSAFVPGGLITNYVLLAFGTLHHMKNKRKGRVVNMATKLEMSKACYERVE